MSFFAVEEAISVAEDTDVAYVQARARVFAQRAGLTKRAAWAVAIVASELATNIVKFGAPGRLTLRDRPGVVPLVIEIEASDRGPGFEDAEAALRDGVSEGLDRSVVEVAHASRRGLGLGLGAVRRLADELTIAPRSGGGTILTARVRLDRTR